MRKFRVMLLVVLGVLGITSFALGEWFAGLGPALMTIACALDWLPRGARLNVNGASLGAVKWVEPNPDCNSYIIHCTNGDYET